MALLEDLIGILVSMICRLHRPTCDGLDVKDGSGQEVTKPNYRLVPIMGTVNTLTSGKSFTLNCEFYTQPEQVLGYLAKYPVNAQGDGFATSHDDAQTDLVNWKVAKDFINGKDITLPNGQKQNFKMIDLGFSNLLGLGYYYLTYTGSHNYTAISTGVENEPGRLWTANGGPSLDILCLRRIIRVLKLLMVVAQ